MVLLPGPLCLLVALAGVAGPGSLPPGTPITDPSFDPPVVHGAGPRAAPGGKLLFVQFDGVQLQFCGPGDDDPHGDCSTIFTGTVLPFSGNAEVRAAVIQAVRADLAPYDIVVTTQRPPDDIEYDMEVVGNWYPPVGGGFAGIAPKIDCFDTAGSDTSFTLDLNASPIAVGKVILQEVGHTWGLEHVGDPGDLLYPTVVGAGDPTFEDKCIPIVRLGAGGVVATDAICPEQHSMYCSTPNTQNSHQELLGLFGEAQPDTTPPTVAIVDPADGSHTPSDFHLVVEITDAIAPQSYATTVELVGLFSSQATLSGPGVFPIALTDIADGHWTVRVTAVDEAGNPGSAEIEIDVGQGAPASGSSSGGGGSSGGPSTATAGTNTGMGSGTGGSGTDSAGPGATGGGGGCGCATDGPPSVLALAWLVLGAIRRRR